MLFSHHLSTGPIPSLGIPSDIPLGQFLALVVALIAFLATIRLWLTKALLDSQDAILKEGYAQKCQDQTLEVSLKDKDRVLVANGYILNLRDRIGRIKRQLRLLKVGDTLLVISGLILFHVLLWNWLPWGNWTFAATGWNGWVVGFQVFHVAVWIIAFAYLRFLYDSEIDSFCKFWKAAVG